MTRPLRHSAAALFLALWSSACVFAVGTDADEHKPLKPAGDKVLFSDSTSGVETAAATQESGAKDPKAAVDPEAAKKKEERKAEKKARELTYARMELALAEMEADNDLRDAKFDVEHARQGLEAAQRELDHFQKTERPLQLEDAQLDLDRTSENALEQRQELDELVAMYKKDDFAKMTKELVLQRGKSRMEMAQRELELSKRRMTDKQEHDFAVKERDLGLALAKAQEGVMAAEAKLKKVQAHNELELMRARHKVEDAERPDDDEGGKGA